MNEACMQPKEQLASHVLYLELLIRSMHTLMPTDDPIQNLENLRDCLTNRTERITRFLDLYRGRVNV